MPNRQHVDIIKLGVDNWNKWKDDNYQATVDLEKADLYAAFYKADLSEAILNKADFYKADLIEVDLRNADLSEADLRKANLSGANLSGVKFFKANLLEANLSGANLCGANLSGANLSGALSGANLIRTNFDGADLKKANLSGANLFQAVFVNTILEETNLTGCYIYGISAWDIKLNEKTIQSDLIITKKQEPKITVDNLEVAQFIYLLLNNKKIRHVIDTITSKVVLILGRFNERKDVLDAIREKLREFDYLPVLFDFEKSENRDITETISLLARMARFVIADITDARSIPQELMCIVPDLPSVPVPVQPLLQADKDEYGMFEHFKNYPWVLNIYKYKDLNYLLGSFEEKVIFPAEAKAKKLIKK